MPAIIPNNVKSDLIRANVNFATDTFRVMLMTSAFTPNRDTQSKRAHISGEASGAGYTAGGEVVPVTIAAFDFDADRQDILLGSVSWPASSITARYAVYYKARGGAASADELVFINDFGADVTSSAGTLLLPAATLRLVD